MMGLLQDEVKRLYKEGLKGNKSAVRSLIDMAFLSCVTLQNLSRKKPAQLKPFAEQQIAWPDLVTTNSIINAQTEKFLKSINLGGKCRLPINFASLYDRITIARGVLGPVVICVNEIRKRVATLKAVQQTPDVCKGMMPYFCSVLRVPHPDSPPKVLDSYLKEPATEREMFQCLKSVFGIHNPFKKRKTLRHLIAACPGLPELTKDPKAINSWMIVIRRFIMDVYDGHPEKSHFRLLGISRARHTDTAPVGSASSEANIRDGIFINLRQALKNLARDPSPD
jgi:hypothetical protein